MPEDEYKRMFGKSREEMLKETEAELKREKKAGNTEKVNELREKLKNVFVGDDVLWANEVASNLFVAVIMAALFGILVICLILDITGVFKLSNSKMLSRVSVCIVEILIGEICFVFTKGQKPWVKHVMMFMVCMVIASATSLFGYRVLLLLTLPVILSTKYLSEKFTRNVAICSGILFVMSNIIYTVSAAFSPDYNMVEYPVGTVIEIKDTLSNATSGLAVNMEAYLHNEIFLSILPNFLQYIVIVWICTSIAKWGHNTMMEQAKVTKEFTRVDTELNMARDIQANVLPNIFPAFPERPEIDIYASMTPAKEVGGDFYDFFLVDEDHLGLVIADVSGKGMPAALFMMIGKTMIKNQAMAGNSPAEVMRVVNQQLCENNDAGLFITAWLGILEISTGKLTACNAGHEYPIWKAKDEEYKVLKDKHGLVLGGMEGMKYTDYTIDLTPGDRLFLFTDGVTEATNEAQEQFGRDSVVETLNRNASADEQKKILEAVHEAVDAFAGSADQFDDLTMLGITYFGPRQENK